MNVRFKFFNLFFIQPFPERWTTLRENLREDRGSASDYTSVSFSRLHGVGRTFGMNTTNFAEELTHLLVKWTTPSSNSTGVSDHAVQLTQDQILSASQIVFESILGANLSVSSNTSMKTPATGIAVCTPNAPVVSKNVEEGSGSLSRFRSLDALTQDLHQSGTFHFVASGTSSSLKRQATIEIDDNGDTDPTPEEKKKICRSNPAIYISDIGKCDTFIRENFEKGTKESDKSGEETNDVFATNDCNFFADSDKMRNRSYVPELHDIRRSAMDVVTKIDNLNKKMQNKNAKPIRRLSSTGFPGLSRSSSLVRPTPPPKLRRSSTGVPGTPTSSKLNTTIAAKKRPSLGGSSVNVKSPKVISPSNLSISATTLNHSVSQKSPGRPAKNPKYAHVQSTIPKVVPGKRKAQ